MGLFSKRKKNDDVIQLTTYGQLRSHNDDDIFPHDYYLEQWFMTDAELDVRFPKQVRCNLTSACYSSGDKAVFNRVGTNSYRINLYRSWGECYGRIHIKSLTVMTPLGTALRDGGTYVLLEKKDDHEVSEIFDRASAVITVSYKNLYIVDKDTYYYHYYRDDRFSQYRTVPLGVTE